MSGRTKEIRAARFATSTGDDENLAYVYCADKTTGYCLSLSRFLNRELIEVMVLDQVNHKTREVSVELSCDELRLRLSLAAAGQLDGITEYLVPLSISDKQLQQLEEALSVIFEGGNREKYVKRL